MQNIVNPRGVAGGGHFFFFFFKKTLVLVFDRSRVSYQPVFPLKKAKNVLGAKNNNVQFLRF